MLVYKYGKLRQVLKKKCVCKSSPHLGNGRLAWFSSKIPERQYIKIELAQETFYKETLGVIMGNSVLIQLLKRS